MPMYPILFELLIIHLLLVVSIRPKLQKQTIVGGQVYDSSEVYMTAFFIFSFIVFFVIQYLIYNKIT